MDSLFEGVHLNKPAPRNDEPAFDAANVLRFGEDLIYLVSATGNELGGHWLQSILGDKIGSISSKMFTMAAILINSCGLTPWLGPRQSCSCQ